MATLLLAALAFIAALYIGLHVSLHIICDPHEPHVVATSVPLLAPLFHMAILNKKSRYFVELRKVRDILIYVYVCHFFLS